MVDSSWPDSLTKKLSHFRFDDLHILACNLIVRSELVRGGRGFYLLLSSLEHKLMNTDYLRTKLSFCYSYITNFC